MEIKGKKLPDILKDIARILFFLALFALPWMNKVRASLFLLISVATALILVRRTTKQFPKYYKQFPFILLGIYYLFQIVTFFIFPDSAFAHYDMERKMSLVLVPLLFAMALTKVDGLWKLGVMGFVSGTTVAAIGCFIEALVRYNATHSKVVFFYHEYAKITGLNAIYLSFYLLIALGYLVINPYSFRYRLAMQAAAAFLYFNLILLSSKLLIVTGSVLIIIPLVFSLKSKLQKAALVGVAAGLFLILAVTNNPVKQRFDDVVISNYTNVMDSSNFTNYNFDGLSIRLLLWRMGTELVQEKKLLAFGAGGGQYHDMIQYKMTGYHLYLGDAKTGDTGFRDYNMHNQYVETYVQFGLPGITLLLLFVGYMLWRAIAKSNKFLIYTVLLFALVFLTESLLETQAGILIFTIIISGEWIQLENKKYLVAK